MIHVRYWLLLLVTDSKCQYIKQVIPFHSQNEMAFQFRIFDLGLIHLLYRNWPAWIEEYVTDLLDSKLLYIYVMKT